jgi:hypothetical protein
VQRPYVQTTKFDGDESDSQAENEVCWQENSQKEGKSDR